MNFYFEIEGPSRSVQTLTITETSMELQGFPFPPHISLQLPEESFQPLVVAL